LVNIQNTALLLLTTLLASCAPGNPALQASSSAIEAALRIHNAARSQVGVSALTWSDTLARQAKAWGTRCRFEHSDASTGENLYATSSLGLPEGKAFTNAAEAWVNERKDYSYSSNSCAAGRKCGHYTQIVWRDTRRVGCAAAVCANGIANFQAGTLVVCEYDPPGNVTGRRPY
jgi:pathogenesis-related protein 1